MILKNLLGVFSCFRSDFKQENMQRCVSLVKWIRDVYDMKA